MERRLAVDNRLAATVLDTVGAVVCVMNSDGHIILFNQASQKLTGYAEHDALGRYPWDFLILQEEAPRVREVFRNLTLGNFPNQHINHWLTRDGEKKLISWSNTALGDASGKLAYIIATGIDITDKKAAEDQLALYNKELERIVESRTEELQVANNKLKELAFHDNLTGLYNRHHFNSVLEKEVRRARRHNLDISLMMCDVDHFKDYNDSYGHITGDQCLREVANIFTAHFQRAAELVARYGGEEFCVLLPGVKVDEAQRLAEQLRVRVFEKSIEHNSSPVAPYVTISIGVVSSLADSACAPEALLRAADNELYESKKNGRNRVSVCTELSAALRAAKRQD